MTAGTAPEPAVKLLDEDGRRLAGPSIARAALGWWPAFTLEVYGVESVVRGRERQRRGCRKGAL
jgi:hypothetical protein